MKYKNSKKLVFMDGAMGTMLSSKGYEAGAIANVSKPEEVLAIHKAYISAGSDIIVTNSFSATELQFKNYRKINEQAVSLARQAVSESAKKKKIKIAAGLGPTGYMVKPVGRVDFEDAVRLFSNQLKILCKENTDYIIIETMDDLSELRAAIIAARETYPDIPVISSMTFNEKGFTSTGTPAEIAVQVMDRLGASVVGVNCSFGPEKLIAVVKRMREYTSKDIIAQANAGLPELVDGNTIYDLGPYKYAKTASKLVTAGATYIGGCCGTTPEHISELKKVLRGKTPPSVPGRVPLIISGRSDWAEFSDYPLIIGERINYIAHPEIRNNLEKTVKEGLKQKKAGADALDVNMGRDESKTWEVAEALQRRVGLPIVLDSQNPGQVEKTARLYPGILLLNSISCEQKKMKELFPIVKKYGLPFVGLCLDDSGVPTKVKDKIRVYNQLCKKAAEYGISSKDIIADPLTLSVASDDTAGKNTLKSLAKLKCNSILGISNISSHLPDRALLNQVFSALAVSSGCSALIVNPMDSDLMYSIAASALLTGRDKNAKKYINIFKPTDETFSFQNKLSQSIYEGNSDIARKEVKAELKIRQPFEIINSVIMPALDKIGELYRKHIVFLPQLIESAQAAQVAMGSIQSHIKASGKEMESRGRIVIATVKGDVHDIGKNLVALLLKNASYEVMDLGVDVPTSRIIKEAIKFQADLIALSSLMTTTMKRMEETVENLKKHKKNIPVIIGGAAVSEAYASEIGAHYGKDAVAAVKTAAVLLK